MSAALQVAPGTSHVVRSRTVAFLVLLPAPARARIVAADLRFVALHLTDDVVAAGARRARAGLGRRVAADRAEGRGGRLRRPAERDLRRPPGRLLGTGRSRHRPALLARDRREPPQVADDLLLDAVLHRLEEGETLFLVLDERIALAVAAQADAFLQMVEAVEVVLPLRVDDLQHDVALDPAEDVGRHQRFLLL